MVVTWAPSANSRLTFSYFTSHDQTDNVANATFLDVPGVLSVPALCYDVAALSALPVGNPTRVNPTAFAAGPSCTTRAFNGRH